MSFRTSTFSGQGSAWFTPSQLVDFSSDLSRYPLNATAVPALSGGIWARDASHVVQESLRIDAQPSGSVGHIELFIKVEVPDDGSLSVRPRYSASIVIHTEYGMLARLSDGLRDLAEGRANDLHFSFPGDV